MVDAHKFVVTKAYQLSNYAAAAVQGVIPETEVDLYCWDTIEEWSQVNTESAKVSPLESAFWYLLHQITFWSVKEIRTTPDLSEKVNSCIHFLRGEGMYPEFCSGVRP